MVLIPSFSLALFALFAICRVSCEPQEQCELLKTSLVYRQEKAPRDLTGVLPVVVERVNRELEGVVDVQVEWTGGDLQGRVGEHIIQCKVTRLLSAINADNVKEDTRIAKDDFGRDTVVQCFQLPFTILDSDECTLPEGHPMRHRCRAPAMCVNTIGSYECVCPRIGESQPPLAIDEGYWNQLTQGRSPWELSFNVTTETSCPSSATTKGCCNDFGHSKDGKLCRAAFRCPRDPCQQGGSNDCAPKAQCIREDSPRQKPNFRCQCLDGLEGNGHACRPGVDPEPRPMVKFDGVTPTEETVKNNFYCGCTVPEMDVCDGFPPCPGNHEVCKASAENQPECACKAGYVNNDDGYGCVDETPPVLKLRGDQRGDGILRLKRGDTYKEYAVDIVDENAEDYDRSLRISYSKPLPPGCLTRVGEFHVNYTIATPWTSPPYVRITRRVLIEDIDECSMDVEKLQSSCPQLIPQCDTDSGATCTNVEGGYTCKCPEHSSGDGFKTTASFTVDEAPEGFEGGTSCRDTSIPVIEVLGPNPKIFKVCKCGGLSGLHGGESALSGVDDLCKAQRNAYETSIKELIASTQGSALCATHTNPNPLPSDCVKAADQTYKGVVDLTSRVHVGTPVEKSPMQFDVPYDVIDKAGNAARAWRHVVIEEVDLAEYETLIRAEVATEKKREIQLAVDKALQRERQKRVEPVCTNSRSTGSSQHQCDCPESSSQQVDCERYCDERDGRDRSCPSFLQQAIGYFALAGVAESALLGVILVITGFVFMKVLGGIASLFGNSGSITPGAGTTAAAPAVNIYQMPQTPGVPTTQRSFFSDPSQRIDRRQVESGLFSPAENRLQHGSNFDSPYLPRRNETQGAAANSLNGGFYDDSIYQQ